MRERHSLTLDERRPGFAEIQAAGALHPDSGAWLFFMREVVKLPPEMTPAVYQAIRLGKWRLALDPLAEIRSRALDAHRRAWTHRPFVRSAAR
jgi:hypothetical protein